MLDGNKDADDITGVYDPSENDITGLHDITGVLNHTNDNATSNNDSDNTETEAAVTRETEKQMDNTNGATGLEDTNADDTDDNEHDNISIELEEHDDNHVTIDDLNIIEQMNTAQINTDPETADDLSDSEWWTVTHHV